MSEETATAAADLDLVRRLTAERDAALARERIAVETYQQQQTSYRELELMYHDAQQNYLYVLRTTRSVHRRAERWKSIAHHQRTRIDRLRAALVQVSDMFTIKGARVVVLDALAADQPPPPPTE